MLKHTKLILALFILAGTIFFIGCQEEQSVLSPDSSDMRLNLLLPPGETVQTATLRLYETAGNGNENNIYRILKTWEEESTTWNTFRVDPVQPAYDDTYSFATFFPDYQGATGGKWREIDVTSLVQGWATGAFPNFGLLIDQVSTDPEKRSSWHSKDFDGGNSPELVIVTNLGNNHTLYPLDDTYIFETLPNSNNGGSHILFTGRIYDNSTQEEFGKQTLIRFDIEPTPGEPTCETAYAYEDEPNGGTCFIDLGFGNWGWSIYLPAPDTYTFEVWAAAGQCNLNNGTHVGNIEVVYAADGIVTFDLTLFPGYTLDEEHYYAGDDPTPLNNKGKPTVAPGSYTISNIGGDGGYIIAHAVVCSTEWE